MITVKDLVEKLQTLDLDMPVYWGIDELPCWIAKADATIEDFPMKIECISMLEHKFYLYFGDYRDDFLFKNENQRLIKRNWELQQKIERKQRNILKRFKYFIFGWDI